MRNSAKTLIVTFICTILLMFSSKAQDVNLKSPKELFKETKARIDLPFTIPKGDKHHKEIKKTEKLFEKYSTSRKQKRARITGKIDKRLPMILDHSETEAKTLLVAANDSLNDKKRNKARERLTSLRSELLTLSNAVIVNPDLSLDETLRPNLERLRALETHLLQHIF